MVQLPRIDRIIFNGVAGPDHLGAFQTRDRSQHRRLHIDRHAGRHAVHVHLVGIQAFRFEKNLVTGLVRELDDLVFDRRAIPRAHALDLPAI